MKRFIFIVMLFVFSIICCTCFAAQTPVYDPTFNGNTGAFFANGTPITISENDLSETIVSWDGGNQVISSTTRVFGGGRGETNYENSMITMNGGTVSHIYGGGVSTSEDDIAVVNNSMIILNGGEVVNTVYGGGLLYSTVENANIIINDITTPFVTGGGSAAATIDGITYATGTEDEPENSLTRVNNVSIVTNGGNISSAIYGGGQGYSYTGNVNIEINSGDVSNLTAGGSNGYTGDAFININGGNIDVYQGVNRGTIDTVTTNVTGGNIDSFNLGGNAEEADVTGDINSSLANILAGNVGTLNAGTSGGAPIEPDIRNFGAVVVPDTVENNNIQSRTQNIDYSIKTEETKTINVGERSQIDYEIVTTPAGYEGLLEKYPVIFTSSNENIATVDENGIITGIEEGNAIITAKILYKTDSADIEVKDVPDYPIGNGIFFALIAIILLTLRLLFR